MLHSAHILTSPLALFSIHCVHTLVQITSVSISQKTVYLRIDMDFRSQTDKATFFYSLDGNSWKQIGNTLQMSYSLTMFMGYRYTLFNFATKAAGGYADFDWFKIGATVNDVIDLYS